MSRFIHRWFTTPWSRVKKFFFSFSHYVNCAMIRETFVFFISALHSLRNGLKNKKLICIAPLPWLRYDHKKNILFWFYYDVHHGSIFLHLTTLLTKKSPNYILPRKTCVTYKLSFSGISVESYMIYFPQFLTVKLLYHARIF